MSIFIERYLGRAQAVEGLVGNWKIDHDQNMFVMDLDEMVQECLDLSDLCRHAWKTLWQLLRREPNGDAVDEAEDPMKKALAKTLEIFATVKELVADAKAKGFAIKDSAALETATQEARQISAKLETIFPPFSAAMFEESRAAFERGECIPIEELIREAQGGSAPAH